jgi:hypothetical protein
MSEPTRRGFLGLVSAAAVTPLVPPSTRPWFAHGRNGAGVPDLGVPSPDKDGVVTVRVEFCGPDGEVFSTQTERCQMGRETPIQIVTIMMGDAHARRVEQALEQGAYIRATINAWGKAKMHVSHVPQTFTRLRAQDTVTLNWGLAL